MANYNTFLVVDCKTRKPILTTTSARKTNRIFTKGVRVEVWNNNTKIETIYDADRKRENNPLAPYITLEKAFIQKKQARAEERNKQRALKRKEK